LVFDALADPSHSVVIYRAEIASRTLRALRWVFVTPGVDFTHHSREKQHDVCGGCNFGARLTIWDRLFGTYIEPPPYIPDTGLFAEDADYCYNPLRFLFLPYVLMFRELRNNKARF
jgi:sterol desaturase/sphingolipid hydroxylase (fatty acid hydroxylase superfamily)